MAFTKQTLKLGVSASELDEVKVAPEVDNAPGLWEMNEMPMPPTLPLFPRPYLIYLEESLLFEKLAREAKGNHMF